MLEQTDHSLPCPTLLMMKARQSVPPLQVNLTKNCVLVGIIWAGAVSKNLDWNASSDLTVHDLHVNRYDLESNQALDLRRRIAIHRHHVAGGFIQFDAYQNAPPGAEKVEFQSRKEVSHGRLRMSPRGIAARLVLQLCRKIFWIDSHDAIPSYALTQQNFVIALCFLAPAILPKQGAPNSRTLA